MLRSAADKTTAAAKIQSDGCRLEKHKWEQQMKSFKTPTMKRTERNSIRIENQFP